MKSQEPRDHLAHRPSFSAIFWCACTLWLGCLAGEAFCGFADRILVACAAVLASALAVLAAAVLRKHSTSRPICLVLLFFALGVLLWSCYLIGLAQQRTALGEVRSQTATVRIVTDPSESSFESSATARITLEDPACSFNARIYGSEDELVYGQEYRAKVSCSLPSERSIASYDRRGIAVQASLSEVQEVPDSYFGFLSGLRREFTQKIGDVPSDASSPSESKALLSALVVGDRSNLFSEPLYQEVKVLGLAHLVAVSGSHLVIVNGFVLVLLRAFRLSRKVVCVVQIAFLFVYLVMVGFPISCMRAACMSITGLLSMFTERRSHALSALGAAVIVLLALDPSSAFSVSFGLSALSTLGIIAFMPLFSAWARCRAPFVQSVVVDPVAMTCAALLTTFPLSIHCFAQFSLIAPLSNAIAAPFVSVICIGGLLAFFSMPCEALFAAISNLVIALAGAFCNVCHVLSSIPFAAIPLSASTPVLIVVSSAACVLLWLKWPSRISAWGWASALTAIAIALCLATLPRAGHEVVMLDVGQGDAFLIRSGGVTLLVDTGNDPQKLLSALSRAGCFHIDALLITHADDDHCGCIKDMTGIVSCGEVLLAQGIREVESDKTRNLVQDAQRYVGEEQVRYVACGDRFQVGAFAAKVVSPDMLREEGGNQDSICFTLESDIDGNGQSEWSAFFCGDAEAPTVQRLVDDSLVSSVDVLKVAHHGAKASLTEDLAKDLSPRIALISVGEGNRYGHPDDRTIEVLEENGADVLRSDISGNVTCSFTIDAITVETLE